MSIDHAVEDVKGALTKAHNIVVIVEIGVDGAGTVLDGGVVALKTGRTVGAEVGVCAVEIDSLGGHVRGRALNTLASTASISVGIVEASEPKGTDVGGEGPFTNPDGILDVLSHVHNRTVVIAVEADVSTALPPGEVLMSVHDNVFHIIIFEKIVPGVSIEAERIMEDEEEVRVLLSHHRADSAIEILECTCLIEGSGVPGLIDWLNSVKSLVATPSIKETLDGIDSPVDIIGVDLTVAPDGGIEFTHPLTVGLFPMREVVLVFPDSSVGEARVVISVLGALHGVHVEQDLDVVLLSHVKSPGNLVLGALSAANVGTIGLEGPVTDRETDDLNFTRGHVLEGLLSDPSIPMLTQNCVSLIGTEGLAEGVLIHANTLILGLAEEAVEKSRGDPRLKDLPTTKVGANHSVSGTDLLGSGKSCESSKSERLHI